MSTHTESDTNSKPGHGDDHPFKVTVRSLAGHSDKVTVKPSDTIGEVRDKEVKHFISKGWLTAGEYALTLPRVSANELDPTATFGDLGVVEDDVLVLINRKPQVDGRLDHPVGSVMALHPAVLADLLDAEVRQARLKLGGDAGDLRRVGTNVVMTVNRTDGTWLLQLDGSRYDSEPFDVALIDDAGAILPLEKWIPGFALGIHPSLNVPFVCVSGTRGYYSHESHFTERWDSHRYSMRLDTLLDFLLRKAGVHA